MKQAGGKSGEHLETLLHTSAASTGMNIDFDTVLEVARNHFDMDVCFISRFDGENRTFTHVNSRSAIAPRSGASAPLSGSYCEKMTRGEIENIVTDTLNHPVTARMAVTSAMNIRAYAGVPIILPDGELYGSFCSFSHTARPSLGTSDLRMMLLLAGLISTAVAVDREKQKASTQRAAEIRAIRRDRDFSIALQPVVDMKSRKMIGMEALARFTREPYRSPDLWFAQAAESGQDIPLELECLAAALDLIPALPEPLLLSINLSPAAVLDAQTRTILQRAPIHRVTLELTEHSPVDDYAELSGHLADLRRQGLRLAIDDTGSGYASFRHVLKLKPDVIKLDRELVFDIEKDPARQALAASIIAFGRSVGSMILAEGIETEGQFDLLRDMGVDRGQGYFISRPLPLDILKAMNFNVLAETPALSATGT